MKLLDIHLLAFGPFSDRHLALSEGDQGLHVIYGPNEAGKSSALRAVSALLFGVPERTQDDFLHGKQRLRIGGRLRRADGTEFLCYRRKGRKNTLLDAQEEPIDENRLQAFLGGVDERLFQRLFGIDHQSLVTGGQSLLEERGREAEALFGSGIGSSAVHAILRDLDSEAEQLFVPRGATRLINQQLTRVKELGQRTRSVSLAAHDWKHARRELEQAEEALQRLDEQLADAVARRNTLQRIRRTLPGLAKRAMLGSRLEALAEVPVIDDDFARRHEAASVKQRLAMETRRSASRRAEALTRDLAELVVNEDLLAQEEAINDLREQLGSYRNAKREQPKLTAELSVRSVQVRQALQQVDPGATPADLTQLRVNAGTRRQVTDLGGRRAALVLAVANVERRIKDLQRTHDELQSRLQSLPNTPSFDELKVVVDAALRTGDLDGAIGETSHRLAQHRDHCARDLAALGLWRGGLDALLSAPLPSEEALRRFEGDFQQLQDECRRIDESRRVAMVDRHRHAASLRTLELTAAVPSEADLAHARERRDLQWQQLRQLWQKPQNDDPNRTASGRALAASFETEMLAADEIADRLRRESQRVLDRATAAAGLEASEARMRDADAASGRLDERRKELEAAWQALWAALDVAPRSAAEMRHWLIEVSKLRDKLRHGEDLRADLAGLSATRARHIQALVQALQYLEQPVETSSLNTLANPLRFAQRLLQRLETQRRERATLAASVTEQQASMRRMAPELQDAQRALSDWRRDWRRLMQSLGLADNEKPSAALDYLQRVDEVMGLADEVSHLEQRIAVTETVSERLAARMTLLSRQLAPDLVDRPVEEAVAFLCRRLDEQKARNSRRAEVRDQLRKAQDEVAAADAALQDADEVLQALCRQAGCASPEGLVEVERGDRERRALSEQLRVVEHELLTGGDGLDLEALTAEAEAMDHDRLMSELDVLEERIEQELRPQRERLVAARVNVERDVGEMAGGDRASQLAEEYQQALSQLRVLAERYVRARLSAYVLRAEMERFRKRHRDPILTGAGEYFRRMTCEAFTGIQSNFDAADQPVLVGVRASGAQLHVEQMSTGTRDQLYLALRLATLDNYLQGAEPLPFIVDDILVQFDDDRARATLAALADFSDRTQVILFTHHARVVDQAGQLNNASGRVFVQRLN